MLEYKLNQYLSIEQKKIDTPTITLTKPPITLKFVCCRYLKDIVKM